MSRVVALCLLLVTSRAFAADDAFFALRVGGVTLGLAGAAATAVGAVQLATTKPLQVDGAGNVLAIDVSRVNLVRQSLGLGWMLAGAGASCVVIGALMALVVPATRVSVAVLPSAQGLLFSVALRL